MLVYLRVLLIRLGIISIPYKETYIALALGEATASDVYRFLKKDQVDAFVALHEEVKKLFEGDKSAEVPDEVLVGIAKVMAETRRFYFFLSQIDAVIERNLEKEIEKKRGRNVVGRE